MAEVAYDSRYLEGIDYFNRGDFFASHEAWEKLWQAEQGPARQFLKGLIQAAVALHHLNCDNPRGATRLLAGSRRYLLAYRPAYWGIDVDGFLSSMENYFSDSLGVCGHVRAGPAPCLTPSIHLEPPPPRAGG